MRSTPRHSACLWHGSHPCSGEDDATLALALLSRDRGAFFSARVRELTRSSSGCCHDALSPYSGGGYCSEAHAFAQSLSPFLGSRLGLVQHGDSINMRFINGLDAATRVQLQGMLLQPPRPYDVDPAFSGVAIRHSEPGAWHPANYQTSRCPPPQGQSLAHSRER